LLEIEAKPEEILAAVLKEWYWKEFSTTHYSDLKQENFSSDNSWWNDRRWSRNFAAAENGQKRLFVAKWKLDWLNPWSLIQFIENETKQKLGDVWNIDILREFSFINLNDSDSDMVLRYFKSENPRKPLIVQAKEKSWWNSFSGWRSWNSRWPRSFGWRGGWFRWLNRWGSSRWWYRK
jgi:hypothetical protein